MGLISPFTVIKFVSLFHLSVAYFMMVSPKTVAEQNIVVILGGAMQIPPSTSFNKPSEATTLCALILGFIAISDLIAASLPTRSALDYWLNVTPARLLAFFGITGYIYATASSSSLADMAFRSLKGSVSASDTLRNQLVFTTGFMESMTWFWIFGMLRDERTQYAFEEAKKEAERLELEKDRKMYGL